MITIMPHEEIVREILASDEKLLAACQLEKNLLDLKRTRQKLTATEQRSFEILASAVSETEVK